MASETTAKMTTSLADPVLKNYGYDPKEELFRCWECDYQSNNRLYIRQHMVSHSEVRPFGCHYDGCDKTYKRKPELKRHIEITHLELRPYVCPIDDCHRCFTQSASLKHHIQCVHSKIRFECQLNGCQKIFTNQKSLRFHQKRRHLRGLTDEQFKEWVKQTTEERPEVVPLVRRRGRPKDLSNEDRDPDYRPGISRPLFRRAVQRSPKQPFNRRYSPKTEDNNQSFVYECNFEKCQFKTCVFAQIADHFTQHWSREWEAIRTA